MFCVPARGRKCRQNPEAMAELEINRYSPDLKKDWDDFIDRSKNGTFLLKRGYMDYHSDRFEDHSLLFLKGNSIQAVIPACRMGDVLVSHAGLTYGGCIMSRKATTEEILRFFFLLRDRLRSEGFRELRYKPVPHIYHSIPAEEDLYALFRMNATLTVRNVSASIYMPGKPLFRKDRKAGVRKAISNGLKVMESTDYASFWKILQDNLASKYGAFPVHSPGEIEMLAGRFPDNIRLYLVADQEDTYLGGTVLFICGDVVHAQYISANPRGKQEGAIDILFDRLINETFQGCRYFDFGTSNEDGGRVLNESLICQKEGFGAHAVCYDTYSIEI